MNFTDPRQLNKNLQGARKREKEIKENKEAEAKRNKRIVIENEELRAVLSNRSGRRVLLRILNRCGIFKKGFVSDPNHSYFNLGQREIGLVLQDWIDAVDPDYFIMVLKEKRLIAKESTNKGPIPKRND